MRLHFAVDDDDDDESDDSIGPGAKRSGERPGGSSVGGVGKRAERRGYVQERRGKHKQVRLCHDMLMRFCGSAAKFALLS